jgi:hypothetical protein
LRGREGLAHFSGKFGDDKIVRAAQQGSEFGGRYDGWRFDSNPTGAGEIRSWNDARFLGVLRELFWSDFKRQPEVGRFQCGDGKHFAAHFKNKIIAPLDVLGGCGKCEAKPAKVVYVHVCFHCRSADAKRTVQIVYPGKKTRESIS